jgi:hypothetical protein
MKIRIDELGGAASLPNGTLSLGFKSLKDDHTLELSPKAQEQLFLSLIASAARDPLGNAARRIRPQGLSRFQLGADVGLSFLLTHDLAVQVLLARPLAQALRRLLDTFDDPSTWDTAAPTRQ